MAASNRTYGVWCEASGWSRQQLRPVNTFPVGLQETYRHLTLGNLEVSHASHRVIDRAGVELPGQRDTVPVTGGLVTEGPTPTDYIWAPIILS